MAVEELLLTRTWHIALYARCVRNYLTLKEEWKHVAPEGGSFYLCLTSANKLLVAHGDRILDSFSLVAANDCMRGFARCSTLLLVAKFQTAIRKVRMKFFGESAAQAEQSLQAAASLLSRYFVIDVDRSATAASRWQQLAVVAQPDLLRVGLDSYRAASSYVTCARSSIDEQKIVEVITLCLCDPTFPDFVDTVGRLMSSLTNAPSPTSKPSVEDSYSSADAQKP